MYTFGKAAKITKYDNKNIAIAIIVFLKYQLHNLLLTKNIIDPDRMHNSTSRLEKLLKN